MKKKIYCISDTHGNYENLNPDGYDIVIIAGDFSKMYGFGKIDVYWQRKWIENEFMKWTDSYPKTQFVIIPGNHDLCLDKDITKMFKDMDWNIRWHDNVHFLCNSGCEIDGLKFYGSPNVPIINFRWAFESNHNQLNKEFNKIPYDVDFLITHSPPRIPGAAVDYSLQTDRGPFGSSELTEQIIKKHPRYVICGHIHSGNHERVEFEGSVIYNVSRLDEAYEIGYEHTVIEA